MERNDLLEGLLAKCRILALSWSARGAAIVEASLQNFLS